MNKFWDNMAGFFTSEPGFIITMSLIFLTSLGLGVSVENNSKMVNFQNTLDKVLDCRKTNFERTEAKLDEVCGPVPTWEQFSK